LLTQDHEARNAGGPGGVIPVVAPEGEPSVLATPDSYAWFMTSGAKDAPTWLNQTSLESVARLAEYWPAAFIDLISPKPLLVQAASLDTLIPIDQVRAAPAATSTSIPASRSTNPPWPALSPGSRPTFKDQLTPSGIA
jgi:hypothetical protein